MWRLALVAVFLVTLAGFIYAIKVVGPLSIEIDLSIWVQSWRIGWLDSVMKVASFAGNIFVAGIVVVLLAVTLILIGRHIEAGLITAAVLIGFVVVRVVKFLVARPRPSLDLVEVLEQSAEYSFPSGHVVHYVVLLGTLTLLLSVSFHRGVVRWLVWGIVGVVLAYVGLSRIYLGVHWLGDILAGYMIGALIVAGVASVRMLWCGTRKNN